MLRKTSPKAGRIARRRFPRSRRRPVSFPSASISTPRGIDDASAEPDPRRFQFRGRAAKSGKAAGPRRISGPSGRAPRLGHRGVAEMWSRHPGPSRRGRTGARFRARRAMSPPGPGGAFDWNRRRAPRKRSLRFRRRGKHVVPNLGFRGRRDPERVGAATGATARTRTLRARDDRPAPTARAADARGMTRGGDTATPLQGAKAPRRHGSDETG